MNQLKEEETWVKQQLEEDMPKRKSYGNKKRVHWLKEGEKNTNFFSIDL
jgi:hypothetical protein